ncbi:MAG: DUF1552 domain-containing protein [Myxococcaceae bacterium]|nr:DUF1552 domain-containing protein [Myxococcaceae bacterium]
MKSHLLSRRTLLRGAGVGLALPLLEAMLPRKAAAQTVAPTRLVLLHWPQGCDFGASDWSPGNEGIFFPTAAGASWPMTKCLMPLAPHRADFNLLSGICYGPLERKEESHDHAIALFTGAPHPVGRVGVSQGPSVDQVAARAIGTSSRFSSVGAKLFTDDEGWWSHSAAGVANPLEANPRTLFDRLFPATGGGGGPSPEYGRSASVLDAVKADAARLQRKLGRQDQQRLEQHLTSVRELEKAVAVAPPAPPSTCMSPQAPANGLMTDENVVAYAKAMIDLLVLALECDLTRVTFLSLGPSQNYHKHPHLGVSNVYHTLCHSPPAGTFDPYAGNEAGRRADYHKVTAFYMEQVAYYLSKLKAPRGALPPLLDSAAFVACSEFSDAGGHQPYFLPFIVAGKANKTMTTGQNLTYRCEWNPDFARAPWCANAAGPANRTVNDVWTTTLRAVGALQPNEVFGDVNIGTTGLSGLWA